MYTVKVLLEHPVDLLQFFFRVTLHAAAPKAFETAYSHEDEKRLVRDACQQISENCRDVVRAFDP